MTYLQFLSFFIFFYSVFILRIPYSGTVYVMKSSHLLCLTCFVSYRSPGQDQGLQGFKFCSLKITKHKTRRLYYLLCMSISSWCVIPCLTRFNILLCLDIFFIWLFLFNMLKDSILFYSFRVYYFVAWLN